MTHETNSLAHHGIKGQHWGIRRFQNEDGSLTNEGRDRYKAGKEYSKERKKILEDEKARILDNDKKYRTARNKRDEAASDYDEAETDFERGMAEQRRYDAEEKMTKREMKAFDEARKYADDFITKKYGDNALSDIEHYEKESSEKFAKWFTGAIAATALFAIGFKMYSANKRAKDTYKRELQEIEMLRRKANRF